MKILLGYILTFGWVFLMLGLTLVLKKATHADDEISRKIIHVSVAFAWIPMYLCFGTSWHLIVPPACFIVLNYISYKKDLFTAMERSDKSKQSPGTVYYAVSMSFMALVSVCHAPCMPCYAAGLFCMALGDGFAPIFGSIKKGNRKLFKTSRTLYGSLSVFVICFLVILTLSRIFDLDLAVWKLLLVALEATVMELCGVSGLDNLTLPIGVFALMILLTLN